MDMDDIICSEISEQIRNIYQSTKNQFANGKRKNTKKYTIINKQKEYQAWKKEIERSNYSRRVNTRSDDSFTIKGRVNASYTNIQCDQNFIFGNYRSN